MKKILITLATFALLAIGVTGCGGSSSSEQIRHVPVVNGQTGARISRSVGEAGGFVILWPRVIPSAGAEAVATQASALQARLVAITERVGSGHPIDVRPEPERACPRAGCAAAAIGAVLLHQGGGCAIVATAAPAGQTRTQVMAWGGGVEVINANVPFREPVEEHVQIRDMIPCADIIAALDENEEAIGHLIGTTRHD